jgi:hypothetical protein
VKLAGKSLRLAVIFEAGSVIFVVNRAEVKPILADVRVVLLVYPELPLLQAQWPLPAAWFLYLEKLFPYLALIPTAGSHPCSR